MLLASWSPYAREQGVLAKLALLAAAQPSGHLLSSAAPLVCSSLSQTV